MPRPSNIELLDRKFRDKISSLIQDKVSYEEIAEMMNDELEAAGLDIRLSKSGVGRYGHTVRETAQRMAETQEFAQQLAMDLGEKEGDQTFDLMVEMMSHLMFKCLRAQTMQDVKEAFNTGDFMKMAISMKTLSEAKLKDINYRREVRNEVLREAAETGAKAAKEAGLSAKAVNEIKAKILGLPQ